jgi:addiction module RelB/DinJ family antitoxin
MTIRMDCDVKEQAQRLFSRFGLDMTTAINMFLNQAIMEQSIPFKVQVPQNIMVSNYDGTSQDVETATDYLIAENLEVFEELAK